MKFRTRIGSVFSLLLFLAGVLLEIAISVSVLWGELEARLYMSPNVNYGLSVKCPYILSFDETGIIKASIINTLDQDVQPMITAEISRTGSTQQMSQALTLAPHESNTLQWKVDASNVLFGRLILVRILQGNYEDLPARQGYCGILFLSLFGMNGRETIILLCSASFVLLMLGTVIWMRGHLPLNLRDENIARAFGSLATLTTIGLFTALLRWWGLIIILDTIALILIIVIFTEVLFNPQ
jgi:hypothetical protein